MMDWNGVAWCSQHQCHPTLCFDIHNPTAHAGGSETADEMRRRIRKQHKKLQKKNRKKAKRDLHH